MGAGVVSDALQGFLVEAGEYAATLDPEYGSLRCTYAHGVDLDPGRLRFVGDFQGRRARVALAVRDEDDARRHRRRLRRVGHRRRGGGRRALSGTAGRVLIRRRRRRREVEGLVDRVEGYLEATADVGAPFGLQALDGLGRQLLVLCRRLDEGAEVAEGDDADLDAGRLLVDEVARRLLRCLHAVGRDVLSEHRTGYV